MTEPVRLLRPWPDQFLRLSMVFAVNCHAGYCVTSSPDDCTTVHENLYLVNYTSYGKVYGFCDHNGYWLSAITPSHLLCL